MGMVGFLPLQHLINKLIKYKEKTKISAQYLTLKISLMISIIEKYTESTKYYKEIVLWVIGFL
jgi:hypothetical protein